MEGGVVLCGGMDSSPSSCLTMEENGWRDLTNTVYKRWGHSSAVIEGRLLLLGGRYSPTSTEWVSVSEGTSVSGELPLN